MHDAARRGVSACTRRANMRLDRALGRELIYRQEKRQLTLSVGVSMTHIRPGKTCCGILLLMAALLLAAGCGEPEKEYYIGGGVKTEFCYNSRGQLHGAIKHYTSRGRLLKIETWKDGKKEGLTVTYGDQGQILSAAIFTGGRGNGLFTSFYDNGSIETECMYANGVIEGPYKKQYKNGALAAEVVYVQDNKDGPETLYYASGMPQKSAYYTAGELQCPVIEFYESGAVRLVQSYRNNQKNGIAKEYFENGRLKAEILCRRGENIASIEYDESGKLISSTEEKKDFDFLEHIPRLAPLLEWAR